MLFFNSFPDKAPIKITEELYRTLISQKQDKSISEGDNIKLSEALNCKYCHCVKKLYLENKFNKFINNKEQAYNPYAICMSSIYKRRDFTPPTKVSYSCRDKYDWYSRN